MPRRALAQVVALLACCPLATAGDATPGAGASLPLRDGEPFLFRFHAPEARNVFLAGCFNAWASNDNGAVRDLGFAMQPAGDGLWTK